MAISKLEAAMYGYITGRTLPKGSTRMAVKAALAAAITAGRAVSPYAQRAAVATLPPVARAIANPYVGVPLAVGTAAYGTQRYLDESGMQQEINVAQDEALRYFSEDVPRSGRKTKKRIKSTYNKAISTAMDAVKKSTFQGKKGVINNAKKTFGMVSKTVSRMKKGGKISPKGVSNVIKRAVEKRFPNIRKVQPGSRSGMRQSAVKAKRRTNKSKGTKRTTSNSYTVRRL